MPLSQDNFRKYQVQLEERRDTQVREEFREKWLADQARRIDWVKHYVDDVENQDVDEQAFGGQNEQKPIKRGSLESEAFEKDLEDKKTTRTKRKRSL